MIEKFEVKAGTPQEQAAALVNRYHEVLASEVADLLVQGHTIDQIEVLEPVLEIADQSNGLKTVRVTARIVGRREIEEASPHTGGE